MAGGLPEFVPPMLASIGRPFDSDQHLFEIKWDGTRALAFLDGPGYRLLNRKQRSLLPGYPELAPLAGLPEGLVLDGEVVVFQDGAPSFRGMLTREQARDPRRVEQLARTLPACYVAFDLLYQEGRSIMEAPLTERRQRLQAVVEGLGDRRLVFSDGVVGAGRAYFEQATSRELEGIVAKRLDSTYRPGKRTDAWQKIKAVRRLHCAILGFVPKGDTDLKSLIIAIEEGGVLTCVGRVGSGLGDERRRELHGLLTARLRDRPLIDCGIDGKWVEPGLFCTVSYLERTSTGQLRAPVFQDLIIDQT